MKNDILTLLEQPFTSVLAKKILQEYEIEVRTKTHYYANGNPFKSEGYYNTLTDISIGFENTPEGEKVINTITIEPVNGVLSVALPFDLALKDTAENIIHKLGKQPKSKSKSGLISTDPELYQYAWWFVKDGKQILTALNGYYQLLWIRIMSFSQEELRVIEFQKKLKLQKNNIHSTVDFTTILKESPCVRWAVSLADNRLYKQEKSEDYIEDFWFNEEIITATEKLINQYIAKLEIACSKKSGLQIHNAVKWFVKKMNHLNNNNNYFIETLERDELGEFIDKTIAITGLKLPKNTDITLQWREW